MLRRVCTAAVRLFPLELSCVIRRGPVARVSSIYCVLHELPEFSARSL